MKEYIVQAIAQETIDSFDAHNAPELVRCENCIYFEPNNYEEGDSTGRCRNRYSPCENQQTDMTWFCADGEKKET